MISDRRIPCTIMRGGTSKGLFFLGADLPSDAAARTRTLLAAFGSPDPRQIDGLGGADPLTSKLAIIQPSTQPGVEVEYTFGQVSIQEAFIDFSANCGNISSAVGPFAVLKGLVAPVEPVTRVRILNTNTRKMIVAEVPVLDGTVVTQGPYCIDGVPGSGAEIRVHFLDPAGGLTGKLLPTGNVCDRIRLEDGRELEVSIVDAGNAAVFIRAVDLGLEGSELPADLESRPQALAALEEVRSKVSVILGLSPSWKESYQRYRSLPKVVFVAPPAPMRTLYGKEIGAKEMNLRARVMTMGRPHKAFAVTAAIPTAAASQIPGSMVHQVCRAPESCAVRIGHPSGVISVDVAMENGRGGSHLQEVTIGRTARLLMDGHVFVPALNYETALEKPYLETSTNSIRP